MPAFVLCERENWRIKIVVVVGSTDSIADSSRFVFYLGRVLYGLTLGRSHHGIFTGWTDGPRIGDDRGAGRWEAYFGNIGCRWKR